MKTMCSNACLLGIALLMGAAFASAENTKAIAPTSTGRAVSARFAAAEVTAFGSEHILGSALTGVGEIESISTLIFEPLKPGGYDGNDHDGDRDRDHDRDHDHDYDRDHDHDHDHDKAPTPAPEPLTGLLFGAAMLIGGGILRRRQRKTQTTKS